MTTLARLRRLAPRFWSRVDKHGPIPAHAPSLGRCWLWTGATAGTYRPCGHLRVGPHAWEYAPRVSWSLTHGRVVPRHRVVMHRCDTPLCVRPSHLRLGTHEANMADMVAKGRQQRGSGHHAAVLTESQAVTIRERYAAGGVSQRRLAREFGIVQSRVSDIVNGKAWRHAA